MLLRIRGRADETGGPLGFGRAFGRYLIAAFFWWLPLARIVDVLWPLWDPKNQALHDKTVGSVVRG